MKMTTCRGLMRTAFVALALITASVFAEDQAKPIPAPDGKPADMNKPVQVFILMGQSNMVGAGAVNGEKDGTLQDAVKNKGLYGYLVDDAGNWTERKDVRNVFIMGTGGNLGKVKLNQWLSINGNNRIGPEQGIGHVLGNAIDAPVLILKSCIGNRCLGYDLLPPGSERYEYQDKGKTMIHGGYKDFGNWEKGTEPPTKGWYAGCQYDSDVQSAKLVLKELDKYYPGAKGYEVAGFLWWQGDKDRYQPFWAEHYEKNLVNLIKALRKDFDAPDAKFVVATLGQTDKDNATGNEKQILDAMFAISDPDKHPELKGQAATVYTHPLSKGGASNSHYGGNAQTYINVGEAMGRAMADLIDAQK